MNPGNAEAILTGDPDWQLAWYDVPGPVIESVGAPLEELLGRVPDGLDELTRWPRPRVGWRLIHGQNPIPAPGELSVLAAPWPAAGRSMWALLDISNPDGHVGVVTSGPERLRPGRATRSRGLHLEWRVPHITHHFGHEFQAELAVRNISSETWIGDGQDHDLVSGTVVGLDGSTAPPPLNEWARTLGAGPIKGLGPIPPGGTVELTLTRLDNTDPSTLPAGEWLLEAQLQSLNLPSPPITVIVTP